MLVMDAPGARLIEQVGFCEGLAGADNQYEIVGEKTIHGRGVVDLHSGLIFRIESRDFRTVIGTRSAPGPKDQIEQDAIAAGYRAAKR